jgi:hypothetical protein
VRRSGVDAGQGRLHHRRKQSPEIIMAVIIIAEVHGQTASGYDGMLAVLP